MISDLKSTECQRGTVSVRGLCEGRRPASHRMVFGRDHAEFLPQTKKEPRQSPRLVKCVAVSLSLDVANLARSAATHGRRAFCIQMPATAKYSWEDTRWQ